MCRSRIVGFDGDSCKNILQRLKIRGCRDILLHRNYISRLPKGLTDPVLTYENEADNESHVRFI